MSEIILWALLAFFGAFGLVEFVRFVYTDWNSSADDFHIVIQANKAGENIEGVIRNAIIETGRHPIIVLGDNDSYVLESLTGKYEYINVMTEEEYIKLLKEC